MSDFKFDIPFKSDLAPTMLTEKSVIKFRCHKEIECFNACCKHADVTLAPYDIIRMKNALGMTSEEFLKAHTVPFQMDAHGMPGIKLRTDNEGACLFMKEGEGCGIYEDRPSACRYYPAGLLAMKPTEKPGDENHFFLIKEDHCKGHEEDREITIADYRKEQEVEEFDDHNQRWYQHILKKKSGGPAIGKPSEMSLQLFFMASYDVDRFRRFVMSDSFKNTYAFDESFYESMQNDLNLLEFGLDFLHQILFGEKKFDEKDGAWEKRMEERQEIWELRREVEVKKYEEEKEEALRAATLGDGETACDGDSECTPN